MGTKTGKEMKLVIKLLTQELGLWKKARINERHYYKGYETDTTAIKSLKECDDYIEQITKAIEILKSAKWTSPNF